MAPIVGTPIAIGIRPEFIEMSRSRDATLGIPGEATVRYFLGNAVLYEVRAGDQLFRVQTTEGSFKPRDRVALAFAATAWCLFPDPTAHSR